MKAKSAILSLAIGSIFAVSLGSIPSANAANNPFGMQQLSSGYLVAEAQAADGKCGDKKAAEAKCGDKKAAEEKKTAKKAKKAAKKAKRAADAKKVDQSGVDATPGE